MPRISEEWSSTLTLENRYIGKMIKKTNDDELKIYGEMTLEGDRYQVVPVNPKYYDFISMIELTEEEQGYIKGGKATVFMNGTKYEGETLIIVGKNVTITGTKVDYNVSAYDESLTCFVDSQGGSTMTIMDSLIARAINKASNTHKEKSKEKPNEKQESIGVQGKKSEIPLPNIENKSNSTIIHSVISVPSENALNLTVEGIEKDIQVRSREFLDSVKKMHEQELEVIAKKTSTNIVNKGTFYGAHIKMFANFEELLKSSKKDILTGQTPSNNM